MSGSGVPAAGTGDQVSEAERDKPFELAPGEFLPLPHIICRPGCCDEIPRQNDLLLLKAAMKELISRLRRRLRR